MAFYYQCTSGTYESVQTFGIALFAKRENCSVLIKAIPDLSTDQIAVEKLAYLCNELQLDPIHLDDVLDDFLTGL